MYKYFPYPVTFHTPSCGCGGKVGFLLFCFLNEGNNLQICFSMAHEQWSEFKSENVSSKHIKYIKPMASEVYILLF
jgi:hypothetical protein